MTGLNNGTTYYWRVKGKNSYGSSGWSTVWSFTTIGAAPQAPTLSTPANLATDQSVSPTLSWNVSSGATSYTLQVSTSSSFGSFAYNDSGMTGTSQQVTGLNYSTKYYWRVQANNSIASSLWSTVWSFVTLYPSSISINSVVQFPSHSNASDYLKTDYRMVGLPGNPDSSVSSCLGGSHNVDWQVYWDNGAATDYLKEWDGSGTFRFTAGKAFWLIYKGNWSLNANVPTVGLNSSQQIELPLHAGWNLVTNPFVRSIPWANVLAVNGLSTSTPLYSYNGSWGTSTSFDPYVGYLLDNTSLHLSLLKIPVISGSTLPQSTVIPVSWTVSVGLSNGSTRENIVSFGVSKSVGKSFNALDFRRPRTIAAAPGLYFPHPEWDDRYNQFATDIRPEFNDLEEWTMRVSAQPRTRTTLSFSGVNSVPSQFEVYLLDESRARSVNLREDSVYTFAPVFPVTQFTIVVGRSDLVKGKLDASRPKEFTLGKNYPNPFNPVTTIPVEIPQRSEISLKIYSLLGEELKTLYAGSLDAGKYYFDWDGRSSGNVSVPSGVYFYRMITPADNRLVGKMILLK